MTVTENWSGRKYQPNKTAQRVFVVSFDSTDISGATEQAAVAATVTFVAGGFPLEPALMAQTPTAERIGPVVFEITWPFKVSPEDIGGDPLLLPPTYDNDVGNFTDICEYDIDDNAKTNSVGDPFDPPPTKTFDFEILIVEKYMTIAGLAAGKAFQSTVNSAEINVPIFPNAIRPGEMKCVLVKPAEKIDATMSKVRVVLIFHYRRGRKQVDGIYDSWMSRFLDVGMMGFDEDGKKDFFFTDGNAGKIQFGHAILLDGNGVPLDPPNPNVTVGNSGTPTAPPEETPGAVDAGPFGTFILFQDLDPVDFMGLGIF